MLGDFSSISILPSILAGGLQGGEFDLPPIQTATPLGRPWDLGPSLSFGI